MLRDHLIASPQVAFLWRLTAGGIDTVGTRNFATYPMFSIARAVRRDTKYGKIVQPEQAISVMDGIRIITLWSAKANFLDRQLGTIDRQARRLRRRHDHPRRKDRL